MNKPATLLRPFSAKRPRGSVVDERKNSRRNTVIFLIAAILICAPNLFSLALTPTGAVTETPAEAAAILEANGIHNPELQIISQQDLQVFNGVQPDGYVNMLNSDETLYLKAYDEIPGYFDDVVLHEYGHILQKNLIDSYSSNSYERYLKIIELNVLLTEDMPALNPMHEELGTSTTFIGLETNADCIAALMPGQLQFFSYVSNSEGCSLHDLAVAKSIMEGDWPTTKNVDKWEPSVVKQLAEEKITHADLSKKGKGSIIRKGEAHLSEEN